MTMTRPALIGSFWLAELSELRREVTNWKSDR
jgi:hypothetical protein